MLAITRKMLQQAQAVAGAASGSPTKVEVRVKRRVEELGTWLERTQRVVAQTNQCWEATPMKDRLISLFDPDARPIRKGKLKAPTEFGYKPTKPGAITDYQVLQGNPSDKDRLVEPIKRHPAGGKGSSGSGGGSGNGFEANDLALQTLGVEHRSLPKTGKKDAAEQAGKPPRGSGDCSDSGSGGEGPISLPGMGGGRLLRPRVKLVRFP